MSNRLAAADAALKAGRTAEAIEEITAALTEDPERPVHLYRVLVVQLYLSGRFAEGEAWAARAVERHPRDFDLWNARGVLLRKLKRYPEALQALDLAIKLDPRHDSPQVNRGNVLLDLKQGAKAEAVFAKLLRKQPRNAEFQRQLGRALLQQDKPEPAILRFRQAVAIKKDLVDGWLDLAGTLSELDRTREAEEALERGLSANPDHPKLLEAKAVVIRRAGQPRRAEAYLTELLPRFKNAGWLHYQLGGAISEYDRERANPHLRRAVDLDPSRLEFLMALIETLERTRSGDEGAHLEESYRLAKTALALGAQDFTPSQTKVVFEILVRVCAFDEMDRLSDFRSRGRGWAESGRHTALLKQLAHVQSLEDRYELLEQHRIWGRSVEAKAARQPIRRPPPGPPGGKIRLGFMSSDLRRHPVGSFALPLFEHLDRERFEVFCYSFYQGQEDDVQRFISSRVAAYRWTPDISSREAAQMIADDQLDMLIELGGSTFMNKLDVMAYRPAPKQASWLGYPHSAGLSTIDYLIVDPYILPEQSDLLIEQPLVLKNAWYPLAPAAFRDEPAVSPEPPVVRNGFVTFGTANNPQKYNRQVLQTWARVMQACQHSRFLFIRPEGGCQSFRDNILAQFSEHGITADRILFEAVRGTHLPHYNRIDISLDSFPQTGGTTTCECLWMGAPCVTLVGEGPFERLSYSVLTNLELGELCARSLDDYVEIAVRLAHEAPRIAGLRSGMRDRMRASPLGRVEAWARDFYDLVAQTVGAPSLGRAAASARAEVR